jgi:DNA-binding Xre family transcriptional regulator
LNTAKRWSSHQEAQEIDRIDKDTLESIAVYLDAPIEDLIEIVDE